MITAPICCGVPTRLTDGREIYPNRADLADKAIYVCDACGARVGCHPGTTNALGIPANAQLRDARMKLHDRMIDPLWMTADQTGDYAPEDEKARMIIRQAARGRVYAYLAHKMGLDRKDTHTANFTLEQCRDAWQALQGVTYPEIRAWAKARKAEKEAG